MNEALRAALRDQGGLLAELADDPAGIRPSGHTAARDPASPARAAPEPSGCPGPPQMAASGPRTAGREAEYELLLEMILLGSRLHYARSELDPDVALLLGDQLYALGLARLAAIGDLHAVAVLGDVISRVAQAHAEGRPELAETAWDAGARQIGWGSGS